jgi:phage recombination protein Bet
MTQELATINYGAPEIVRTLKETVAQGLTDSEFKLFAEHCKSTGLNPFKKEVWAIKAGGRLQIMTGIGGYLAIANKHPEFDGMVVTVDNDEKPTKAICLVYRKDRKYPSEGVALISEYRKETPIWKSMPRVMLTKVAKSIALREAFPQEFNGIYTEEEMPAEYSAKAVPEAAPQPQQAKQPEVMTATHYYNLASVPVEKQDAAIAILKAASAEQVTLDSWKSPVEIKKLAAFKTASLEAVRG